MSTRFTSYWLLAARARSRALLDVAIAVAALGGSLAVIQHGGVGLTRPGSGQLDPVSITLAACSTLPLIAWRRSPLGVFVVTAAVSVLLAGLGYRIDLLIGPAVAIYLLAASREPGATWTWRTTSLVIGLFVAYLGATAAAQDVVPDSEFLHTGFGWAVAWFAGERSRLRRELIADLRAHAARAEREAERERLLAAAEERARIARDLHDSVGHAINLIAVRAGAARLRHRDAPDRSLLALEAIEEVARQTAADIDHIVGSLREASSASGVIEAPVGLLSLGTLIQRHRETGLGVTLNTSGAPRRLGAAADQAAYRILQESLTNAARHGAGSALINIGYGTEWVELTVTNPVSDPGLLPSAGGHGLVGMRERATLLGGSLEADRANGTFRLRARIPDGGHAA